MTNDQGSSIRVPAQQASCRPGHGGHAVERVDKATRRDEQGDSFLFVRPEYKISREIVDLQVFFYSATGHDWAMSALDCA
jgi:hypothetical protein